MDDDSSLLPLSHLKRIAVFRALMVGDLMCAVPALRALRLACPQARITLIGLPWARSWVERSPYVDDFIEFPGFPGMPEVPFDAAALPRFLARMQAERFELLLQLHGSGLIVNPLMAACGAQRLAGFAQPPALCPDEATFIAWPAQGHEIERLLRLTDHLGIPRQGLHLEFPLADTDRQALAALWPESQTHARIACVHVGSQLPSRRWLPERFAQVADALALQGHRIVLTGSAGEKPLADAVQAQMTASSVNLAGKTTLWTLGALLERAALLVCNDTGVSHVAAALATPSVVISSGAEVARWAPLDAHRHPVLWHDMPCRPCTHRVCNQPDGCAHGVTTAQVLEAARTVEILTHD